MEANGLLSHKRDVGKIYACPNPDDHIWRNRHSCHVVLNDRREASFDNNVPRLYFMKLLV